MKKKKQNASTDTARKIWLAGIGAYGRAFSEAQESLARMSEDTSKVFDELVEKGEQIEQSVEETGRAVASRVAPRGGSIEERVKRMRDRLGIAADFNPLAPDDMTPSRQAPPSDAAQSTDGNQTEINARLDRLETKIDKILDLLAASAQPPRARSSTSTSIKSGPSRKKASAKKSTAKRKKRASASS